MFFFFYKSIVLAENQNHLVHFAELTSFSLRQVVTPTAFTCILCCPLWETGWYINIPFNLYIMTYLSSVYLLIRSQLTFLPSRLSAYYLRVLCYKDSLLKIYIFASCRCYFVHIQLSFHIYLLYQDGYRNRKLDEI